MRNLKSKSYLTMIVMAVLALNTACSSSNNTSPEASSEITTTQELSLTLDELKQYDGQNGNAAYVAVDGVIYDVTRVRKWKDGKHEMGVTAGQDLTDLISQSPHGKSILSEAPIVGKIK